jgi:transcriptional regulator with XRE-family HTH domain
MPGASTQGALKRLMPTARERQDLRKRVGAFIRQRREELGLSQGDIIKSLGYTSRNSVSNLETGREGLPAKRIYAWADILQLPRDAFFLFATGESEKMAEPPRSAPADPGGLSAVESELVTAYRKLPPKYQRRLLDAAEEFQTLARAAARTRR